MTRAAANSMASGTPSRRWQASTTERALLRAKSEVRLDLSGPFDEQIDGVGTQNAVDVLAGLTNRQRRQRDQLFAVDRHAFPACGQHYHTGTLALDAAHQPGHCSSTCSQLSSTNSNCFWDSISMRESSEYCPPGL